MSSGTPWAGVVQHLRRHYDESLPDLDLLSRFAARRDEAAFAALVRRHGGLVLGVARRQLADRQQAEDVVQATFLALARQSHRLGPPTSLANWLYTVALRQARKAKVRSARQATALNQMHFPTAGPPDPLAEVSGRELVGVIDEELARLPEAYRLPLLLCALQGLSREEAARQLGWSAGAVKGRLERGRELLRQRLEKRGLTVPAAFAAALATDRAAAVSPELVTSTCRAAVAALLAPAALGPAKALVVATGLLAGLVAGVGGAMMTGQPQEPKQAPAAQPATAAAPVRIDRFGDPLPEGAVARLGTVRWRAGGHTRQVSFPRDGTLAACATSAGVQFWDAATGWPLDRPALMPAERVHAVALSPDGKLVATGTIHPDGGRAQLWDMATGREVPFLKQEVRILQLAFSPTGTVLAGWGVGTQATLWEVPSGKVIARLDHAQPGQRGAHVPRWLAFAPDGAAVFTDTFLGDAIRIWDVKTGRLLRAIGKPVQNLRAATALSGDGKAVAMADGEYVVVMDVATARVVGRIRGDPVRGRYTAVIFAGDRHLAARNTYGIDFFNLETSRVVRSVGDMDSIPGGTLYASPDGSRVILSNRETPMVRAWDGTTGREVSDVGQHTDAIASLAIEPGGRTLLSVTGFDDARVRRWDLATGRDFPGPRYLLRHTRGHVKDRVTAFSPDGSLLAIASSQEEDGSLPQFPQRGFTVLDVATGKTVQSAAFVSDAPHRIAWSPDGKVLATAIFRPAVELWDVATGGLRARLTGESEAVAGAFALASDGRTLAVAYWFEPAVWVWDVPTEKPLHKWPLSQGQRMMPGCVTYAPDGRTLFAGDDRGQIRRWDVTTGRELPALTGPPGGVRQCLISPDGKLLIAGGVDGSLWAWDAATGRERRRLPAHRHPVTSLVMTPDGKTLASGCADTTILLWDISAW
jgi:RNA polymerase sigma factor (sigma-70 family)